MPTTQVLALRVVCAKDKEVAAKLPNLSKILGQICPDLNCKVVGEIGFVEIRDCEVLEKFYEGCIAAKERLHPQSLDLSPIFYLALAGGCDYAEAMSFSQCLLTAIIPAIPKILTTSFCTLHTMFTKSSRRNTGITTVLRLK